MNELLNGFLILEAKYPHIAMLVSLAIKTSGIVLVSLAVASFLTSRSGAARCWAWRCSLAGAFVVLLFSLGSPTLAKVRLAIPVEENNPAAGMLPRNGREATGISLETKAELRERDTSLRAETAPRGGEQKQTREDANAWRQLPWSTLDSILPFIVWGVAQLLLLAAGIRIVAGTLWLKRQSRCADGTILTMANEVGKDLRLRAPVRVRFAHGIHSPLVLGIARPLVYLPRAAASWTPSRLGAVFQHELAHWIRRDNLWQYAGQAAQALLWWNPLVAMAARRMAAAAEEAADDFVLLRHYSATAYASDLVHIASEGKEARLFSPGVSMTGGNHLEKRIKALLSDNPWRGKIGKASGFLLFSAMAAFVAAASLYVIRAAPAQTPAQNQPEATRTVVVTVQDREGKLIPGAYLKGLAMSAKANNGTSYGWQPNNPSSQTEQTDTTGKAKIAFPKAIQGLDIGRLYLTVYHPDFVAEAREVDVENPEPITLERGALVTVKVPRSGRETAPYADFKVDDFKYHATQWKRSPGDSSVSAKLPETPFAIRAVAFDPDGGALFSPPEKVSPRGNESITLTASLKPGTTMSGRLGASVPRPVKNGRVVASVTTSCTNDTSLKCQWNTTTEVEEDGTFTLRNLPDGDLDIIGICDGFVSRNPQGALADGSRYPQRFVVGNAPITLPMEATGVAKVTVRNPEGAPLSDASVVFWPNQVFLNGNTTASNILGRKSGSAETIRKVQDSTTPFDFPAFSVTPDETRRFQGKTGSDGSTIVENLPAGKQNFSISVSGWEIPIQAARGYPTRDGSIDIKAGQEASLTITMEKEGASSMEEALRKYQRDENHNNLGNAQQQSGRELNVTPGRAFLSGQVLDESGKPIEGALVDAWTWYKGNETLTDKSGKFFLKLDDEDRRIEVRVSKKGLSPVHITNQPAGELREPVVLGSKTSIEGIVQGMDGKPVAGAQIKALCGPKENESVSITSVTYETVSGERGEFRLPVHPDTYEIQAKAPDGNVASIPDVKVAPDTSSRADAVVTPGATFKAQLRDATTGKPIPGVRLQHQESKEIWALSNDKGEVEIPNMLPGDAEFRIEPEKTGYSRWWSPQAIFDWERFQIEPGGWQRNFDGLSFDIVRGMEPVEILMEKGVTVRGKVVDPNGNPVGGASVDPSRSGTGNSLSGDTRFRTSSAADGSFEFVIPASGKVEYNLTVHDGQYGQWRNWANGSGPRIETSPGQIIEAGNLPLSRPFAVKGKVTDLDGHPVPDREVEAQPASLSGNRYYNPSAKTDAAGNFELKFVEKGRHHVQVAPIWGDPNEAPTDRIKTVDVGEDSAPVLEFKISPDQR